MNDDGYDIKEWWHDVEGDGEGMIFFFFCVISFFISLIPFINVFLFYFLITHVASNSLKWDVTYVLTGSKLTTCKKGQSQRVVFFFLNREQNRNFWKIKGKSTFKLKYSWS